MRVFTLFLFLCCFSFSGLSQINVKGKTPYNLKTMVFPGHNYRIKIDGVLQPSTNLFSIPAGKHYIEIWAPHHQRFDTALYFSSKLTVLPVILKKSPELEKYEQDLEDSKKHLRLSAGSIGGVILLSVGAYVNYNRIGDLNVDKIKAENGVSVGLSNYSAGSKNTAQRKLTNARILQGVLYAGIGAMSYTAVRHIIKSRNIKIVPLKEDKSFIVDGGVFYTPQTGWQTGLVLKF